VANIFISYARADSDWADRVHQWLSADGHECFLDRHKNDGVVVGDDWQQRMFERLRRADALVCVVTPSYLKSVWCAVEIGAARVSGSEILPVNASAEPFPEGGLLNLTQYLDAARNPDEACERLLARLNIIDGGGGRGWPDDRSPYPGLRALQTDEHRVFFGRGPEIKEITERLRSTGERSARGILTVEGPSGCGKSSLVRAGVLPRIAGESHWLTVAPIVPGRDPVGNLKRSLAELARHRCANFDPATHWSRCGLKTVATDLLIAAGADSECKLLVVIDQLEELLTQTEPDDRSRFVAMLESALGGPVQVLATLRPEFRDQWSKDPELSKLSLRPHEVRPVNAEELRSVIEGPARVAGLGFDEGLVARLVADSGGGEALPLLAYSLEQLAEGLTRGGRLSYQRYLDIDGVQGALQRQADAALQDASTTSGVGTDEVIAALLNLVTIDEQGRPTKRRVALDELPSATVAVLESFIARRLLSTEAEGERTFVAVAHEAFLVNWPPLKNEIEAEATALRARRVVENAAHDWAASGRDEGTLLQGRQLAKATVDTGAEMKRIKDADKGPRSDLKRWWPGRGRLVTRVELNETGRAFLGASIRTDRVRRWRIRALIVGAIVILAVATGVSIWRSVDTVRAQRLAQDNLRRAVVANLDSDSRAILGDKRVGGDRRALLEMITAEALQPGSDPAGMLDTVNDERRLVKIIATPSENIDAIAVSPDGHEIVSAGSDHMIYRWDDESGERIGEPLAGHTDSVDAVAFSRDGRWIASGGADKTVRIWDAHAGAPVRVLTGHDDYVSSVAFNPDGSLLATAGRDGTIRLWNPATGERLSDPIRGHGGQWVTTVQFNRDGTLLASAGLDGTVKLWGMAPGQPHEQVVATHRGPVGAMAFSPDGQRIASAGYVYDFSTASGGAAKTNGRGAELRITDVGSRRPIVDGLTEFGYGPISLAFSPDGKRIAVGADDKTIRLRDAQTGAAVGAPQATHAESADHLAYSVDGTRIITGSARGDNALHIWAADPDRPVGTKRGIFASLGPTALSPDGSTVATRDPDRQSDIALWRADTHDRLRTIATGHAVAIVALAWRPDGQAIASSDVDDNTVDIWTAQTGALVGSALTGPTQRIRALAFSQDGSRVAAGCVDSSVWVWDTAQHPPRRQRLDGSAGQVTIVGFSADGRRLMAASQSQIASGDTSGLTHETNLFKSNEVLTASSVRVWDADTGGLADKPLTVKSRPVSDPIRAAGDAPITTAALSPDGQRVLVSTQAELTLRDVASEQPVGQPWVDTAHISGAAGATAFSSDGRYAVSSAPQTANLQLWEVSTGRPLGEPLEGHTYGVVMVAFGAADHVIISEGMDGWMTWPGPAKWSDELCGKLTANMTQSEWNDWVSKSPTIRYTAACRSIK
jgi:WD40 repeat protein